MEDILDIVRQQAEEALLKLGAQDVVTAAHVADSVLRQTAYWETPMQDDERLVFLRLFSPVVQREEVFLGNILLNDFLSKAFARGIVAANLGKIELIANDLQSFYFLLRTPSTQSQLADAFRIEVDRSLAALFFEAHDETLGIYGDMSRMFTFRKSDFEPFPVYAIPEHLAAQLEKAVRRELGRLLEHDTFASRVRTIFAAIAFFYGRTSGGSGDAQSFPNFVDHLVNDERYDGLLKMEDVKRAFNITDVDKPQIKQSLDDEAYSIGALRELLNGLLQAFHSSIEDGSDKWLMAFLQGSGKFVRLPQSSYLNALLTGTQLGYYLFTRPSDERAVPCRLCNAAEALVAERYVTTGVNSFRFNNQSVRQRPEKACVRCALNCYLAQKLLGTQMLSTGGKLPQVAKTYNLIFHYGKHDKDAIDQLARRIDLLWNLIRQHRNTDQVRRDVARQAVELKAKYERERDSQKKDALAVELSRKSEELKGAQAAVADVEHNIFAVCPWLKTYGASPVPAENCSLDALANIQLSESKVEKHVLGLGLGGYRMILFVLPQIRAPRDAKEHDFAQRRFSNSRVTVTAVLSFLRELCGCDGPFYYQSLPTLTPESFHRDTFYVRNEAINVRTAQNEYEVVTQLAWKLVWQRGSDGFVRKVILSEKLLEDPLGTMASVMRDSQILGQTKGDYKRLAVKYRQDWKAWDLTEYARFIQQLSRVQEVK